MLAGSCGRALFVGVSSDEARIDRKGGTVDQSLRHTATHDRLEQLAQQIAIAEAAMPVLGECRMIRHFAVETEPAEPAVSEVQVDLFAQPTF